MNCNSVGCVSLMMWQCHWCTIVTIVAPPPQKKVEHFQEASLAEVHCFRQQVVLSWPDSRGLLFLTRFVSTSTVTGPTTHHNWSTFCQASEGRQLLEPWQHCWMQMDTHGDTDMEKNTKDIIKGTSCRGDGGFLSSFPMRPVTWLIHPTFSLKNHTWHDVTA